MIIIMIIRGIAHPDNTEGSEDANDLDGRDWRGGGIGGFHSQRDQRYCHNDYLFVICGVICSNSDKGLRRQMKTLCFGLRVPGLGFMLRVGGIGVEGARGTGVPCSYENAHPLGPP